jgi:transposase-like protein
MRYPASEKLEVIRTVEASHLPTKQTLRMLGLPSSTYYDWYARWEEGGIDALADRSPRSRSVWNRIPDDVRDAFIGFALDHESLTNLTPADVYHGRGAKILKMREEIKKQTIRKRRLQHQAAAA